jgi:DNA-binding transcriptional MerR regulator
MKQEAPDVLLTVGIVARRSGLLRPARVDDATGYRRYCSDQVAEARLVGLLRSLDLPPDQARAAVLAWKNGDDTAIEHVIRQHRSRLDARVTRLRGALHRIDHLLRGRTGNCHV